MSTLRRCCGVGAAALSVAAGLTISTPGTAYADTAIGQNCDYKAATTSRDPLGNPAPCTAQFNADKRGIASITVDVIPHPGTTRNDPRRWTFDLGECTGTVFPSDPPRTFKCSFESGAHTVYIDRALEDRLAKLEVDY
jgi:hypothetical protein